jgi:hypothetical protein
VVHNCVNIVYVAVCSWESCEQSNMLSVLSVAGPSVQSVMKALVFKLVFSLVFNLAFNLVFNLVFNLAFNL